MLSTSLAFAGGVSDTEIVIGTHLDLSGPVAAGMPMLRNAMQMRLDEANAAGGVNGRKFRLIVEDNGSQPQLAVRAVQKLTKSDDVFAILNPFGSGPNAATVKMATDAGVVVFAPWAASGIIQRVSGNSPLLFTTVQNYDSTTATGVSWAMKNWGSKRIGVIHQEGPFGDLVPTTLSAHAFAVIVVLLGLAVLSRVTASLSAIFVGTEERQVERDLMREIGLLRVEVRNLRHEVAAATGRHIDVPTDARPEMTKPGA